mgnify:CR=1 FL=1
MSELISYGGDSSVVVARSEIERITSELALVQRRLLDELTPMAQLHGIVHHVQLDIELPDALVRLGLQRHGCFVAAESYFSGDARVAHSLDRIATFVHDNPWLRNAIPKQVWGGLAAGLGASVFMNNNFASLGARTLAGQLPIETVSKAVANATNEKIEVVPVSAIQTTSRTDSIGALASRLNNSSGHIRIESFATPSGRTLVMYLPGTAQWNVAGGEKAFDLQSDVELLGDGQNSNSYRAADAALSAFGANSNDRLVVVGYSQGGLVGAELAKHHNVVGLVTMGSPIAGERISAGLPVLAIEHSNDVVPALAGKSNPLSADWATASRHIDLSPGQTVLSAHEVATYVESAREVDASSDSGLGSVRERILQNLHGSQLERVVEYQPTKGA